MHVSLYIDVSFSLLYFRFSNNQIRSEYKIATFKNDCFVFVFMCVFTLPGSVPAVTPLVMPVGVPTVDSGTRMWVVFLVLHLVTLTPRSRSRRSTCSRDLNRRNSLPCRFILFNLFYKHLS